MNQLKKRLFEILDATHEEDLISKFFNTFMILLITLNVVAVILATLKDLHMAWGEVFYAFEVFSVVVFTVEYILRIWTCTIDPKYSNPVSGRIRYAFSPLALIDLLAILPFYLPLVLKIDLRFLRILRLVRLLRIIKLVRYSSSMQLIGRVFVSKKNELLITVFAVFLLLLMASSIMYYVEHEAQPEVFASIPHSMWWGIITLTTVGYGDVFPITLLGKIFNGMIAFLGIGLFALPAGILASAFAEEMNKHHNGATQCPHCGGEI